MGVPTGTPEFLLVLLLAAASAHSCTVLFVLGRGRAVLGRGRKGGTGQGAGQEACQHGKEVGVGMWPLGPDGSMSWRPS